MVETHHQTRISSLISFVIPLSLLLILLLRSSFFPYPEILTEIYFLKAGMLPYTQINDQHFPGFMLLPLNLGFFGITTVYGLRFVHLLLIVINFVLLSKLLKKSNSVIKLISLLLYSLFLFSWEGNTLWVDLFVTTTALLGFYLLETSWTFKNLMTFFLTGLTFGVLLTFKQHGIFLCLAAGLWVISRKPSLKQLFLFVMGGLLPMTTTMLHLFQIGVFKDFWFWTFSHNLQGYSSLEGRWPVFGESARLLSLVIPVFFLRKSKNVFHYFYLFASLFYIFPRFGLIHAQVALPILIYLISQKLSLTLAVFLLALGIFFTARVIIKDTPGKIYFYDESARETMEFVKAHVQPNKPIYVYGVNDNIYHLTQTLPPNRTWIELLKGNIIPGIEDTIISTLKVDPPQFILVDPQASIDSQKISEFTPLINKYIQDNFSKRVSLTNGIEVWYAK